MNHTPHRAFARLRRFVIFTSFCFLLLSAVFVWREAAASGQPMHQHVTTRAKHLLARTTPGRAMLATFFATQTVTSAGDTQVGALPDCSDGCSLREAITAASANDTIQFDSAQMGSTTVSLTAGELAISKNLTIDGGAGVTVTRGSGTFRIFNVTAGTVSMNDLTISNGLLTVTGINGSGAGIFNAGSLTLTRCTITGNTATGQGGGIENNGTLAMTDCTLSQNTAVQGGGLQNDLTLTMTRCTVNNNTATGNPASSYGGGLVQYGSSSSVSSTLINCTFYGNNASNDAGAIGADGSGTMSLTNCTITGNNSDQFDAGGLSKYLSSTVTLTNTIIVGNTKGGSTPSDTTTNVGTFFASSSSNNLIGTAVNGGPTNGTNGNQVGVTNANALLGTFGNYGGLTNTVPLLPGSPAINAGTNSGAPTTDQRSKARVSVADIGAFESQGFTLTASGGNNQSTTISTAFANPLSVTVTSTASPTEPVNGGRITFTPPGSGASATIAGSPATIASGVATSGTVTANGTVGSNYTVTAKASSSDAVSFTLSNTGPATVSSINRALVSTSACANTSVSWTVTFNQSVTGISDTNFSLSGGTGAMITNVSGSGTTWTVTANTGTAAATLGLNMVNSTGVTPTITNLSFTGQTYTINALPTITLGTSPIIAQGATSANLPYTATSGSPNQYSIDYDATANTAGFTDVTNASLTASPIVLTVPGGAAAATYNATLTVRNNTTGCVSSATAFTVTLLNCPSSFTVNDLGDAADAVPGNGVCATAGGVCTLRAAIQEANALTPCTPLTINFSVTGTITLTSALPAIAHPNLTITGPGAANLTVSGNDENRVLSIASGSYNVNLSGLTLSDGYIKGADTTAASGTNVADEGTGAGLYSLSSGTVNVTDCVITNNTAQGGNATGGTTVVGGSGRGAGIYLGAGTNTLTRCNISDNSALGGLGKSGTSNFDGTGYGAGVYKNFGSLTVTDCTIADNITDRIDGSVLSGFTAAQGAGIYNASGALTVTGSTFSGNRRPLTITLQGAALTNQANSTTVTLTNSTFSGNIGSNTISQISSTTTLTMVNCTVANNTLATGNSAAGAIFVAGGSTLNLKNTVLGNNADGPNIRKFGTVTSQGNNFDSDSTTMFTNGVNGDIVGTSGSKKDPKLSALGNYGGLTKTQVPLPDSQLLDAGTSSDAPATDQRGVARPQGSAYDIGAVEAQAFTLTLVGGNNQNTTVGTAFSNPLQVNLKEGTNNIQGASISYVAPGSVGVASTSPTSNTATTDASGNASITATANTVAGSYNVSAFIYTLVKQFSLTNNPGAVANFLVSAPSSTTAGTPFNFTVTARDSYGNTVTGYTGTVNFTSTDGAATLPANSTLTNGVGTFPATLKTAGVRTITATDTVTPAITGTSNDITVNPGVATTLAVTAPATAFVGVAFNSLMVTARDAFGNTATGYTGTVHFTSTDGAAALPANSTLTNGTGTFSATLNTINNQTITATDTVSASITGTSNNILVSLNTCPSAFTVNDLGDTLDANLGNGICADASGNCTLRAAIQEANALTACTPLTINITATGTITLGSALPVIAHPNLTINGPGANQLTVDGATMYRAFEIGIGSYAVTLSGFKIANGRADGGAGLRNLSTATVNVNNMAFTGNAITGSSGGGGIRHASSGTLNVTGSTFINNIGTPTGGGGISNFSTGTLNVTNSTFSGNIANLGNGIHTHAAGITNITNCTLSGNGGNGVNTNSNGTTTIKNTVVVGHTSSDISGSFTGSNNLTGTVANALLGTLGNYGGTTDTFPLLPGSPALNAGTASGAPSTDQRGVARDSNVDIGAFESRGFTLAYNSGSPQSTAVTTAFMNPLKVTVTASNGEPVDGGEITFTPPGSGASATIAGTPATIASGVATTGTITANAITGGPYKVNATTNGASQTIEFSLTNSCPTISVTNPTTTTGTAGTSFSQTFTQTGGITPVSFSTSSTLPMGLMLASNGTLSGTPTKTGTFPITVTVMDANNCTRNSSTYTLVIGCQSIGVINPTTTTGTAGTFFSQSFTQSGAIGTTTFSTNSTLPTGLTLASNGTLSGTPTQTGTFNITVNATDSNGCMGTSSTYSLVIGCQTITVTNPTTTIGKAGVLFSQTFSQSGGIGAVTFSTMSALPTGLTLASNGMLSGTPSQMGSFSIVVKATDSNGCTGTGTTYNLMIECPTITVTNPTTVTAGTGTTFSQTFTQSGGVGNVSFSTSSSLPMGLTLSSSGVLSGIPKQLGTFPIIVDVTDAAGCQGMGATYNLVVSCGTITVTPPAMHYVSLGVPFDQSFTQTGAVGTPNFTLESGTLPTGLMLASNGVLSGTTTQVGSFPIKVKVTDSNLCTGVSATYTLETGNNIPFSAKISDPLVCVGDNYLTVHAEVTNPNNVNANMNFNAVLPAQLTGVAGTCVASFGTCTVNNGSVSVTGVLPANQTVTIDYKVRVANGTAQGTQLCVDSTASLNNGAPVMVQACTTLNCPTGPPANVQAGGQKAGSLLVFPYYVSKTAPRKDTRLTISNIGTQTSYAHIFFIDGTSCAAADQFVCLTPNASASFKASEYDPDTTGWLLAVAVNSDGLPIVNNALIGNAFVTDGDYVDNYNAEAFRAYSPALAAIENVTATLFLDGSSYDAAPSQFAVEVQSPLDAAGQRLVIASLQGDLTTGQMSGASQVGTGLVYNGNEKPFGSFSTFVSGKCQAFGTIAATTPRVPNGMNVMIPTGQVGTLKFNVGAGVGLLMTPRTAMWRGIRALHKTALTNATLTIPIFRPVC